MVLAMALRKQSQWEWVWGEVLAAVTHLVDSHELCQ
jgi:hypothetical protein